jgi:hypothetical protein
MFQYLLTGFMMDIHSMGVNALAVSHIIAFDMTCLTGALQYVQTRNLTTDRAFCFSKKEENHKQLLFLSVLPRAEFTFLGIRIFG